MGLIIVNVIGADNYVTHNNRQTGLIIINVIGADNYVSHTYLCNENDIVGDNFIGVNNVTDKVISFILAISFWIESFSMS